MEFITIQLTRGQFVKVDGADYESLSIHKWYCSAYGYAVRGISKEGKRSIIFMHRVLLAAPSEMEVDHIDGDRLNNCRDNLRLATKADNLRNSKPRTGGTSRFKGVNWNIATQKWRARIQFEGKQMPLGCYPTELEAAQVYNEAAVRLFGQYARLNRLLT